MFEAVLELGLTPEGRVGVRIVLLEGGGAGAGAGAGGTAIVAVGADAGTAVAGGGLVEAIPPGILKPNCVTAV
ncbi:MAG TPA: hypothetical protein VIP80_08310, partial [Gemmatimonadales bacterium]